MRGDAGVAGGVEVGEGSERGDYAGGGVSVGAASAGEGESGGSTWEVAEAVGLRFGGGRAVNGVV